MFLMSQNEEIVSLKIWQGKCTLMMVTMIQSKEFRRPSSINHYPFEAFVDE